MWQWMQTKESAVGADFRPTGLDFFLPTIFLFRNTNYKKKCYFFETYESILQTSTFKAYDFSFFSSVFYCLFGFSVKRLRSFILSPSLMYTYSQIRAYSVHRNFVSRFHLTVPWLNIFRNESIFWELWFIKSLYSNHLWKTFHESCIFLKIGATLSLLMDLKKSIHIRWNHKTKISLVRNDRVDFLFKLS